MVGFLPTPSRGARFTFVLAACALAMFVSTGTARAQDTQEPQPPQRPEELEPRIIGRRGSMFLGVSGFVDKFSSTEEVFTTNYNGQVDVCRFLTKRFAVRVGMVGTGTFGGEEDSDEPAGTGVPSLHAAGGVLFYFKPQSIMSPYVGAEYWAQLTRRAERDTGSVLGVAGLQGAFSSRASFFIQGGFGSRIARGDDDELLTRIVAQIGLRFKL